MGSASSKLRRHLENGDEYSALEVLDGNPELRKTLDPNCFYGDPGSQSTPLHLAAKYAMKPLLKMFLMEMQGDPNVRTGRGETALHLVSGGGGMQRSPGSTDRRVACLGFLFQWRGYADETIQLNAQDHDGNTALHRAAATGIKKCVELLVSHNVSLFVENNAKETACDVAERARHNAVADFLETKMVFSSSGTIRNEYKNAAAEISKGCTGLRPQDLQEAKDVLLVETSDMLHVPLFTAEALLRAHDWSQAALLEAWVNDPVECCRGAGVQPTTSALHARDSSSLDPIVTFEYHSGSLNSSSPSTPSAPQGCSPARSPCNICSELMKEDPVPVPCQHQFCFSCWRSYLNIKIQEGDVQSIVCPAVACSQLVPVDVIEQIVSPDMAQRYLQFDIEAFVESNPNIKWCPWAGCGRAVKLPESACSPPLRLPHVPPKDPVSHAVDCGNGHYFCWECLGPAHAPCSCDRWKEWHTKVAEVNPEELQSACSHVEDAANCLWMVANSKPCPSCKSPIQKNEGCNHIKCSKCKHDFCWICLEPWRKHSSATGGYFRCNRFEAVHRAKEREGMVMTEAETRNKKMQELKRFAHYYTRFKSHERSHKEEDVVLLERASKKEQRWLCDLGEKDDNFPNIHFLSGAVQELLRARKVLCGSYAYGYYLEDEGYGNNVFQLLQHELEEELEKLSSTLSLRRLRTPYWIVVETANRVARKREEFLKAVAQGLVPPESPPALRGARKRRYPTLLGLDPPEDEEMMLALLESMGDAPVVDDLWVKDARGRHANLAALFDWPQEASSDSDDEEDAIASQVLGVCSREGCKRARVRNPRTRQLQEFCSLKCQRLHRSGEVQQAPYESDFWMDLLVALEMSRLQMIQDQNRLDGKETDTSDEQTGACGSGMSSSPQSNVEGSAAEINAKGSASSPSRRRTMSDGSRAEGPTPLPGLLALRNLSAVASDGRHKVDKDLFRARTKVDGGEL